LLCWFIDF